MTVTAVDFLPAARELALQALPAAATGNFNAWLSQEMTSVNRQILEGEAQLRSLAQGNTDNLHHVMIALEEARLSFQLMLQVRNRLLEAYQEVMRTQV